MRLVDSMARAINAVNETARGNILQEELKDTILRMRQMNEQMLFEIGRRFVQKRESISTHMPNWTTDGRLKMSRALKANAKRQLDFNMVEGYALWMASAWLESQNRDSDSALAVYRFLDDFGIAFEQAALEQDQPKGDLTQELALLSSQEVESNRKLIVECPRCGQRARIPLGEHVEIRCFKCSRTYMAGRK